METLWGSSSSRHSRVMKATTMFFAMAAFVLLASAFIHDEAEANNNNRNNDDEDFPYYTRLGRNSDASKDNLYRLLRTLKKRGQQQQPQRPRGQQDRYFPFELI